jgi:ADP-ribosyl-[dinitrogen reductase] hydrolase
MLQGWPPSAISWEAIDRLPTRGDWPAGATSDDTEQVLLVAGYLAEMGAVVDEREFLTRLAGSSMRGIGPSTLAAVQRFTKTGELRATGGSTDGAAMRALPIGWAVPATAAQRRRELSIGLSRTTHGSVGAIGSACAVSAMASRAIDASPLRDIIDAVVDEITWLETEFPNSGNIFQPVGRAGSGEWSPSPAGVSIDAVDALAAVIHVLVHAERESLSFADALRYAVSLGGDTDTVAAIVGGILGSRLEDVAGIPWLSRVQLPDSVELDALSMALSSLRQSFGP